MTTRVLVRVVRSRPGQALLLAVLYASNRRGRYRGVRAGGVSTTRKHGHTT